MKTKVLFFVPTLESGGPTNVVYNIIKYLDKNLIEPCVLTLSREPTKTRKGDFELLGVQIYSFHKSRLYWIISNMKELNDLVDQISPDIIHSHSLRADISSGNHLSNYHRVSTIHGDLFANYKVTYNSWLALLFSRRQINCIKGMDLAVACSKTVEGIYKNKIKKIAFIQNGIDTDLFFQVSDQSAVRKKLFLPQNQLLFISIGSLNERKDPETVIEGFLNHQGDEKSSLIMLGNGELEKHLKKKYGNESRILFRGFVSNVYDYLQASDFFISASHSEGLPNTVLEALGCAIPVCLSDIPSHREILDINPKGGILFNCGSANDLSIKINWLLKESRIELKQAARTIIQEKLNARHMASQYESIYLELNNSK